MIAVYCVGPLDAPHDRFIVAAYRRAHATPTPTPALWTPQRWWGGVRLHDPEQPAPQPDGSMWLRFVLRCDRCGLNEKHKAEPAFMVALFAEFDARWFSGRDEIEVRELMWACRPT